MLGVGALVQATSRAPRVSTRAYSTQSHHPRLRLSPPPLEPVAPVLLPRAARRSAGRADLRERRTARPPPLGPLPRPSGQGRRSWLRVYQGRRLALSLAPGQPGPQGWLQGGWEGR